MLSTLNFQNFELENNLLQTDKKSGEEKIRLDVHYHQRIKNRICIHFKNSRAKEPEKNSRIHDTLHQ